MYCSACGHALAAGQPVCPQCGRPVAVVPPPMPGFQFEVAAYASKMRALSTVWFIYGGLSIVLGVIGLAFADAFFHGRFNYWTHGPFPPFWFGPAVLHLAWTMLVMRAGLALMAGWGLMERASWGRIVAIIAAVVNLIKFPFGTALGIWTLVMLVGYRNATLYDQLPEG